ncbi:hypothetical protein [Acidovorax phage ACPWH]|nr:hypothetical protein [Acidovorax phage ACPWH]QXV72231.1 hypothetical protein Acf1_00034 [Acidovorax phage ACF1]
MHVISPSGTVHNFPIAHHAAPVDGVTRLYASTDKTEWIADVPADWLVVAGSPKRVPETEIHASETHFVQQHEDRRQRRVISLFGLIPLFTIRVGLDA